MQCLVFSRSLIYEDSVPSVSVPTVTRTEGTSIVCNESVVTERTGMAQTHSDVLERVVSSDAFVMVSCPRPTVKRCHDRTDSLYDSHFLIVFLFFLIVFWFSSLIPVFSSY